MRARQRAVATPFPAPQAYPARPRSARAPWFTAERFAGLVFGACILLQRFAIPTGTLKISVATPLVLLLALFGLARGILVIERRRAGLFCALCGVGLFAMAAQFSAPIAFAPRSSLNSLLYWLAITGFAIFRFREPMQETRFFAMAICWLLILAASGVLQFVLQFAHLSLFSFRGLVPDQFLIEGEYAVVIPLGVGGIIRGNGMFLVEPSVFSQFMALGIILEWLCFRRARALGLFLAGLLCSISGTGWLVLGAFALQTALTSGPRDAFRLGGLILLCTLTFGITSVVAPEITDALMSRTGEFSQTGSSGYARFVTPFMVASTVLEAAPRVVFTGIGPGAATDLVLPFRYWLNTPVKLLLEYGILGLGFYLLLLLTATRTARQRRLIVPLFVLLMFTGGYQQFSPILFPVLLLLDVAFLRADETGALGSPILFTRG